MHTPDCMIFVATGVYSARPNLLKGLLRCAEAMLQYHSDRNTHICSLAPEKVGAKAGTRHSSAGVAALLYRSYAWC